VAGGPFVPKLILQVFSARPESWKGQRGGRAGKGGGEGGGGWGGGEG
jgi:hypothetical protein